MGKATLAKQRAISEIGAARIQKLIDAGLVILFADDYERLTTLLAEIERENKLLREIAADSTQASVVAARILGDALRR